MTEQQQNNEAPKRRRKRKIPTEGESEDESSSSSSSPSSAQPQAPVVAVNTIKLTARDDIPVQMDIMDVRDVMGGRAQGSKVSDIDASPSSLSSSSVATTTTRRRDEESPAMSATFSASSSRKVVDDSLQQLLEDAKMMMEEEDGEVSSGGSAGEGSMKASIRNALGTLVTADFFVVCVFLLWFLLGIFCSSILKDDTVQIAFNSTFLAGLHDVFVGASRGRVLSPFCLFCSFPSFLPLFSCITTITQAIFKPMSNRRWVC